MKHAIPAMIAAAALGCGLALPAAAQQHVGADGTDANGPITIFNNYVAETTPIRVTVNGHSIEHLKTVAYDDITTSVHRGTNTMTIAWAGPVSQIHVKISYAPTRNNFKNVAVYTANAQTDSSLKRAGSRMITFTIPN